MTITAVAYARISTITKGQDLENQLVPIREFAKHKSYTLAKSYVDEGISGTKERRKGLDQLVLDAQRGKFKVLIVMEISRLARDVRHLLNLLHQLESAGVSVCSLREGIDFSTPMGRAMISLTGVLVQVERDLLAERIKTALYVKKLAAEKSGSNWKCGRPSKLNPEVIKEILRLKLDGHSIREIAKRCEVSKTTVLRVVQNHPGKSEVES